MNIFCVEDNTHDIIQIKKEYKDILRRIFLKRRRVSKSKAGDKNNAQYYQGDNLNVGNRKI